jgi:hypothetical protein
MATTTIILTYDNPIDWVLTTINSVSETEYVDATAFDRFVIDLGDTELDSDTEGFGAANVFDNTMTITVGSDTAVVPLRLRLGLADVTAGSYKARLIGYSEAFPDGLVWKNKIPLKFIV